MSFITITIKKPWRNCIIRNCKNQQYVSCYFQRYNEMMILSDSCEASTVFKNLTVPNVLGVGSSSLDESSFSDLEDPDLGVATNDKLISTKLYFKFNLV